MLAVDMRARDAMYQTYIDEDVEKLQQMGLGGKMREFEAELAKRIAGEGDGEGVDDQLITQALNLERNEFQRYMWDTWNQYWSLEQELLTEYVIWNILIKHFYFNRFPELTLFKFQI